MKSKISKPLKGNYEISNIPKLPLEGDTFGDEMLTILKDFNDRQWDFDCEVGEKIKKNLDKCRSFVKEQKDIIDKYENLLAKKAKYSIKRPENLGNHQRIKIADFSFEMDLPQYIVFIKLSKLYAMKSLFALKDGNLKDVEKYLNRIFDISSFLQQNGPLIQHMIAHAVTKVGLLTIVNHFPSHNLKLVNNLNYPSADLILEDQKVTYATEWLYLKNYLEKDFFRVYLPSLITPKKFIKKHFSFYSCSSGKCYRTGGTIFKKIRGFLGSYRFISYDREETLKKKYEEIRLLQKTLNENILGTEYLKEKYPEFRSKEGKEKYLPNDVIDSYLYTAAFLKYTAKSGWAIDWINATELIVRARKYHANTGKWPSKIKDFGFKSEKQWPKSKLNGEPIKWDKEKNKIMLLSLSGKLPCGKNDICEFAFEPAYPI